MNQFCSLHFSPIRLVDFEIQINAFDRSKLLNENLNLLVCYTALLKKIIQKKNDIVRINALQSSLQILSPRHIRSDGYRVH